MCKSTGCGHKNKLPISITHPQLAKELVGTDPATVTAGTSKRLQWRCGKCAYEWVAIGSNRAKGRGCPACVGKAVFPGKNDMATTHPELARELVGTDPTTVIAGGDKKLQWRCSKCAWEWLANGGDRARGAGCPACAGKSVFPGKNDMATTNPELARELVGTDPKTVVAGTAKKLRWKCEKCEWQWAAQGYTRVKGHGCPACAGQAAIPGKTDMLTTHPELAKELVETDPSTAMAGSQRHLRWKCGKCAWEWRAKGSDRVRGNGCPACSNKVVIPGRNDMLTTHPELARELIGTDPSTVIAGTNQKLRWRCGKCAWEWRTPGCNRVSGSGCLACINRVVIPGRNDLATTHPHLAAECLDDASTIVAGTPKKLRWRCGKCAYEWLAIGSSRVSGRGCPKCAKYGFDSSKPSFLYLIQRPGQFKYGISNHGAARLREHARNGWSVLETLDGPGAMIWALESALDAGMRAKGIPTGRQAFREPFDGWTEAWNAVDLSVRSIRGLCRKLGVSLAV